MSIFERWAAKVRVADECRPGMDTPCWEWTGGKGHRGYGSMFVLGKRANAAHRVSWLLNVGPADDMHVLHKCDNPGCVAPHHLFLGDHQANMADKVAKGRQSRGAAHAARLTPATGERHGSRTHPELVLKGERCGKAKLSDDEALAVLTLACCTLYGPTVIGDAFGVSDACVCNIKAGRIRKHLGVFVSATQRLAAQEVA